MFSIFFYFFLYSQDQAMKKESGKYFENLKYFIFINYVYKQLHKFKDCDLTFFQTYLKMHWKNTPNWRSLKNAQFMPTLRENRSKTESFYKHL